MTRPVLALALGLAILGPVAAPASANPAKELITCVGCHDVTPAKKQMVGAPLFGIYGSKPTTPGTGFTKWDKASMDKWLKDPSAVKPATSMAFKVRNDAKRAKIVEALAELK